MSSRPALFCILCLAVFLCSIGSAQDARARFIPFTEAGPTLQLLEHLRPPELKALDADALQKRWPDWIAQYDAGIRSRVARGDDDSLVNLVLYGTSFTAERRVTARHLDGILAGGAGSPASGAEIDRVTRARIDDFVRAAAQPGINERLVYAAGQLEARGFPLVSPDGRARAASFLLSELARVLREARQYERVTEETRSPGDPSAEFARRSKMYEGRGLSSDTSLAPNFALDQALKEMQARGLLSAQIRRVAVLGPGLDFADKQEGYDFYPLQTLQPFAVLDSLLRLQRSSASDLRVTTFDLNPRVNRHLERVRDAAQTGRPYVLHLPLDGTEEWTKGFLEYWSAFGSHIGVETEPVGVPANAGPLRQRAITVHPQHVAKVTPVDLDIVAQRLELPRSEKFDLIVGTNVFVYYNEFQQSLAMANVSAMLAPGGVLLSNNALVELPTSPVRSAGASKATYSARPNNGDVIVWYRKSAR